MLVIINEQNHDVHLVLCSISVFTFWIFTLTKFHAVHTTFFARTCITHSFTARTGFDYRMNIRRRTILPKWNIRKWWFWTKLSTPGCWVRDIQFNFTQLPKVPSLDTSTFHMFLYGCNRRCKGSKTYIWCIQHLA